MAKVKRKAKRKITSKKKKVSTTGITKTIEKLISKGKEKGFLTYDEINDALPEDMLSLDQIDETFIMFDANDIEIIDEEKGKLTKKVKKAKALESGGRSCYCESD